MGFVKQPNGKLGSWIVTLADRMLLRLTSRVSGRSFLDTDPIFKTGKLSLCSSKCRKNQPISKNRLINQSLIFAKLVSLRDSNGMAAQTHAWRELPFFFSPFNNLQKSSPIKAALTTSPIHGTKPLDPFRGVVRCFMTRQ
jgi:hypothetical protein